MGMIQVVRPPYEYEIDPPPLPRGRVQRARDLAEQMGLAYWPALAWGPRDINPYAFVYAELVLSARHSLWQPGSQSQRGGWDMKGHYGLSPWDVRKMWFAAGCRNNAKFRLQVANRVVARKSDSLATVQALARGTRWARINFPHKKFDHGALVALGKLSAPMRWVALSDYQDLAEYGTIRVRHFNTEAIRQVQAAGMHPRALAPYLPIGAIVPVHTPTLDREAAAVEVLAPAYPRLHLEAARQIAQGKTPVELSNGMLTRQEAHEWCLAGAPNLENWLSAWLKVPGHRSIRVIRWLAWLRESPKRWEALERQR